MNDLTRGNEFKTILSFSIPFLIGNLLQQLYNVADSIVVGNFLGKESLAAVGFSFQISSLLIIISIGITMGTSILVSRCIGERKLQRVKVLMDTGIGFSLLLSIIFAVMLFVFSNPILHVFRMPAETLELSNTYLRIVCIGILPTFGYNALTNILRGIGDSKTPTIILVFASLLNIALDLLLVAVIPLGVAGAAIATVIAQFFSWIGCTIYINHRYPEFRIRMTQLKFEWVELKNTLKIGIPTMIQQAFISIGFLTIQYLINGFGTNCIAAFTAASKIDGFAQIPAANLGKAIPNFVAQNLGANQPNRVSKGCRIAFFMCIVLSIAISTVILALPVTFIRLFNNDPAVIEIGKEYLRIVAIFYWIMGLMQLINGIIMGYGKTVVPMIASIASLCLLQVPVAILLSGTALGHTGIWIAAPIGWAGGLLIRLIYYIHISKKNC